MTIIAFQIDEFGTTGRTNDGEVLRSNTIPTFSFDYDVLTYTQNERSRFGNWKGTNLLKNKKQK